jgi:hypothetical protein
MVSTFLSFSVTNKFNIDYLGLGPTEVRIMCIFINTLLIVFDQIHLAIFSYIILFLSAIGLIVTAYQMQKNIIKIDIENKEIINTKL